MKRLISFFILFFFCNMLTHAADSQQYWSPPKLDDSLGLASEKVVARGVVKIQASWFTGEKETGSGMVMNYDNGNLFVLTAAHVIRKYGNADGIKVYFHGDPINFVSAELYRYSDEKDMAVLLLRYFSREDILKNFIKYPVARSVDFQQTLKVKTIGHPGDADWSVSSGMTIPINKPSEIGLQPNLARYGISGGPVLLDDNRLVGMVTSVEGNKIGYALSIDEILNQLDAWNIPYRKRIIDNAKENLRQLTERIYYGHWDGLKGEKIPDKYMKLYRSTLSVSQEGKGIVVGDSETLTGYVECLGEYRAEAVMDEVWRIWVNEIDTVLGYLPLEEKSWKVYEFDKHRINFSKSSGTFTWPRARIAKIWLWRKNNQLILLIDNWTHPLLQDSPSAINLLDNDRIDWVPGLCK